jgi:hypothetical protein
MDSGKRKGSGRSMKLTAIMCAAAMLCGCGTVKQVDTNAWARDYYNQPNVAPILHAVGSNVCFTISGATELTLSTPVPPKSIIPRDPGVLDSIGGVIGNVMPMAGAMYLGGKLASRPSVVQAQVVRPEVVTVPAE